MNQVGIVVTPELRVATGDQKVLWRSQGATGASKAIVDINQSPSNRYNYPSVTTF